MQAGKSRHYPCNAHNAASSFATHLLDGWSRFKTNSGFTRDNKFYKDSEKIYTHVALHN